MLAFRYLVSSLELKSTWSAVLYTNTLSLVVTTSIGLCSSEFSTLDDADWSTKSVLLLLLSCVIGLGISWSGFMCQTLITATAYTVVGVMNKMLTVLVNVAIWDNHASPMGLASLVVCLVGGSFYQQAPPRKDAFKYTALAPSGGAVGVRASPFPPTCRRPFFPIPLALSAHPPFHPPLLTSGARFGPATRRPERGCAPHTGCMPVPLRSHTPFPAPCLFAVCPRNVT